MFFVSYRLQLIATQCKHEDLAEKIIPEADHACFEAAAKIDTAEACPQDCVLYDDEEEDTEDPNWCDEHNTEGGQRDADASSAGSLARPAVGTKTPPAAVSAIPGTSALAEQWESARMVGEVGAGGVCPHPPSSERLPIV